MLHCLLCFMGQQELIRKTVGRVPHTLSVFERIRKLDASLKKLNIKSGDDGEHIRRIVGPSHSK